MPGDLTEAVRHLVEAEDEWTAATEAYNAEYRHQQSLGVFPKRLRDEEARHSAARKGWYEAVRGVIETGRAALRPSGGQP